MVSSSEILPPILPVLTTLCAAVKVRAREPETQKVGKKKRRQICPLAYVILMGGGKRKKERRNIGWQGGADVSAVGSRNWAFSSLDDRD
jgi:hypothetical protein